jgi:uroporphyrinogen decarboxylase-like protein
MNGILTPRQILKGLLQGNPPPRPLFVPIVFSLGAKVENLPPRAFLCNATKITNSLRQIRTHLRSDGVSCYFDPYLEAEALGATLHYVNEVQPPTLQWPDAAEAGELPENLRSPEDAAQSPRVAVAVEVIQRLKSLMRDEPLLCAGVSGPFTLAAHLLDLRPADTPPREDFSGDALELAAATITQIASKFVEAGANVIFIQESILPVLSAEHCEVWAESLVPAFNIIRFYEALPVLLLGDPISLAANRVVVYAREWDCVLCPALATTATSATEIAPPPGRANIGIALLPAAFQPGASSAPENLAESLHTIMMEWRPVLVTTAGDVPASTDVKLLAKIGEAIRR